MGAFGCGEWKLRPFKNPSEEGLLVPTIPRAPRTANRNLDIENAHHGLVMALRTLEQARKQVGTHSRVLLATDGGSDKIADMDCSSWAVNLVGSGTYGNPVWG